MPVEGGAAVTRSLREIASEARKSYRTADEMVVAAIRDGILSGALSPGAKLGQEQLALALDVSRIPVRSALRQLEAEGLVIVYPNRGAVVRALDPSDIAEIYELRMILEPFALRLAAEKATPGDLERLSDQADALDAGAGGSEWLERREQFYRNLYAIAERPRTAELIERLRAEVGRYWLSLRVVDHAGHGHRVIADALKRRDASAAEAWLIEHLREVSIELQRRVDDWKADGR